MMREIKYRAWHDGLMYVVQSLHMHEDGTLSVDCINESEHALYHGSDVELMQFTGLHDKNKKPIYEGDIVAGGLDDRDYVRSVVCIGESETRVDGFDDSYIAPYYGVYLDGSEDLEKDLINGGMYVIGNIYENPDLLGK